MSETPEFHIGREIEVKSSHVKFTPAKVIGSASNKDEIMVQYCSPDSTGVKQREAVKKTLLRPKQPVEIGRKFRYGELVDAFVDGRWCEGVIAEVSWDEKRFEVFLKCDNETHKFYAPDIRVHRDWIGGSWIPSLPKELLPRRIEVMYLNFSSLSTSAQCVQVEVWGRHCPWVIVGSMCQVPVFWLSYNE